MTYDDKNNLSSQTQTLNGTTYTSKYAYDEDNRITKTTEGQASASYTYDGYGRMTGVQTKSGNNSITETAITYIRMGIFPQMHLLRMRRMDSYIVRITQQIISMYWATIH